MNKHSKRFLLGCAWVGLALVTIGAIGTIYALVFIGFGLLVGFIALVLWAKKHKPLWHEALK